METSGGWAKLQEAFEGALELAPGDLREDFLRHALPDTPALLDDVRQMLRAHERDQPLEIEKRLLDGQPASLAGRTIGRYRLLRLIGRGGMGEVYEAARDDHQYRQQVALKLLRAGWYSAESVARFRLERQILARLSHPLIVPLLDGGVTEDGRPYFVLQYVEGLPITGYCTSRQVAMEDRLRLLCEVARAVEYAHRNLVVHRDLKPSNILVTAEGGVRLLDFGVAKLLDASGDDVEVPETRAGLRLMTPEYAAPEQFSGEPITTATDIYALGVLAHELLAGCRPLPGAPPPSQAAAANPETAKKLRGDLDTIVLKALEPEAERRYTSAEELARDIERYLSREPVLARRPTARYRFGKFVRRNRLASILAAASLSLLLAFTGVTAWQARRIARERDVARVEQQKSERVVGLLIDLFGVSNPESVPGGRDLTVGEFLQRTERSALQAQGLDLEVQARMKQVLGKVYYVRSQFDRARVLLGDALALFRRSKGEEDPATVEAYHDLARLAASTELAEKAAPLLRASLERQRRLYGPRHDKVAAGMMELAEVLPASAERTSLVERSLEIRRSLSSAPTTGLAMSVHAVGSNYWLLDNIEQAGRYFGEAVRIWNQLYPAGHPDGLRAMNDLASYYGGTGNFQKAAELNASVIDIQSRLLGPETVEVANARNNLATVQASQGDYRSAEENFRAALELFQKLYGRDHWNVANATRNLGRILHLQGKYAEAIPLLKTSADIFRRLKSNPQSQWNTESQLGVVLFRVGRQSEALAKLNTAIDRLRSLHPQGHYTLADSRTRLGFVLLRLGNREEAGQLFRDALEYRRRHVPANHPTIAEAECGLAAAQRKPLDACLPAFSAWGVADPVDVQFLKGIR